MGFYPPQLGGERGLALIRKHTRGNEIVLHIPLKISSRVDNLRHHGKYFVVHCHGQLHDKKRLSDMRESSRSIGRPEAGSKIAEFILGKIA